MGQTEFSTTDRAGKQEKSETKRPLTSQDHDSPRYSHHQQQKGRNNHTTVYRRKALVCHDRCPLQKAQDGSTSRESWRKRTPYTTNRSHTQTRCRGHRQVAVDDQSVVVWVFHGMRGNAAHHSIGLFHGDHSVGAIGLCNQQLRDAWRVQDHTEREQVAGYGVIGQVQEEGRWPPVPENQPMQWESKTRNSEVPSMFIIPRKEAAGRLCLEKRTSQRIDIPTELKVCVRLLSGGTTPEPQKSDPPTCNTDGS